MYTYLVEAEYLPVDINSFILYDMCK